MKNDFVVVVRHCRSKGGLEEEWDDRRKDCTALMERPRLDIMPTYRLTLVARGITG